MVPLLTRRITMAKKVSEDKDFDTATESESLVKLVKGDMEPVFAHPTQVDLWVEQGWSEE